MIAQTYDDPFFEMHAPGSLAAARAILPILLEYVQPHSAVDVGCGVGAWLKVAKDLGIGDILGIDGGHVSPERLMIAPENFLTHDLCEPLRVQRRFDLAICLEVAEHLPLNRAESLVGDLVALSDTVLFSAALPYQGGTHHVNEQWLEFWAIHFRRFGYVPCDVIRRRIWNDIQVPFWYSQNVVVFCQRDLAKQRFGVAAADPREPLSTPHPMTFLVNVTRYRPLAANVLDTEFDDYRHVVAAYQEGKDAVPPLKILTAHGDEHVSLFPEARMRIVDPRTEIAGKIAEIEELRREIGMRSEQQSQQEGQIAAQQREIRLLRAELETRERYLRAMLSSVSWRITGPGRAVAGWVLKLARQFRRAG